MVGPRGIHARRPGLQLFAERCFSLQNCQKDILRTDSFSAFATLNKLTFSTRAAPANFSLFALPVFGTFLASPIFPLTPFQAFVIMSLGNQAHQTERETMLRCEHGRTAMCGECQEAQTREYGEIYQRLLAFPGHTIVSASQVLYDMATAQDRELQAASTRSLVHSLQR